MVQEKKPSDTVRAFVCVYMLISLLGIFLINKVLCLFHARVSVCVDHFHASLFPLEVEMMVSVFSWPPSTSAVQ